MEAILVDVLQRDNKVFGSPIQYLLNIEDMTRPAERSVVYVGGSVIYINEGNEQGGGTVYESVYHVDHTLEEIEAMSTSLVVAKVLLIDSREPSNDPSESDKTLLFAFHRLGGAIKEVDPGVSCSFSYSEAGVSDNVNYVIERDIATIIVPAASDFLSLTDAPDTYVGQSLKGVRVNAAETALEYFDAVALNEAGLIPLNQIPPQAIERLYIYAGVATTPETAGLTSNQVQDGDTVKMLSTGAMYLVTDQTNLNLSDSYTVYSGGIEIARYVYLVNDVSDQQKMGGIANNVYATFQAAYDAANALQIALGSTLKVGIKMGAVTSAVVGDLILAANYNTNVILIGISKTASVLGNIIGRNAAGNGYSVGTGTAVATSLIAVECTVGSIFTEATGATGNSGTVNLGGSAAFGAITTTVPVTATGNVTGNGGNVNLNSIGGRCTNTTINTANLVAAATGAAGNVTILNGWESSSNTTTRTTTSNNTAGNVTVTDSKVGVIIAAGNITLTRSLSTGAWTLSNTASVVGSTSTITITDSVLAGAITKTNGNTAAGGSTNIIISRSKLSNITYTIDAAATVNNAAITITNSIVGTITLTHNGITNAVIPGLIISDSVTSNIIYNGSSTVVSGGTILSIINSKTGNISGTSIAYALGEIIIERSNILTLDYTFTTNNVAPTFYEDITILNTQSGLISLVNLNSDANVIISNVSMQDNVLNIVFATGTGVGKVRLDNIIETPTVTINYDAAYGNEPNTIEIDNIVNSLTSLVFNINTTNHTLDFGPYNISIRNCIYSTLNLSSGQSTLCTLSLINNKISTALMFLDSVSPNYSFNFINTVIQAVSLLESTFNSFTLNASNTVMANSLVFSITNANAVLNTYNCDFRQTDITFLNGSIIKSDYDKFESLTGTTSAVFNFAQINVAAVKSVGLDQVSSDLVINNSIIGGSGSSIDNATPVVIQGTFNTLLNYPTANVTGLTLISDNLGNVSLNTLDKLAFFNLGPGTLTKAPAKFTSAPKKTSAHAAGDVQFDDDDYYLTITTGASPKKIVLANTSLTPGVIPIASTNGRLIDSALVVTTIAAGTYTPTYTNVNNSTGVAGSDAQYMRINDIVTVSGEVTIDPDATLTLTTINISLPVASVFGTTGEAGGTAFSNEIAGMGAAIYADVFLGEVILEFTASDANSHRWSYHFTYQILL